MQVDRRHLGTYRRTTMRRRCVWWWAATVMVVAGMSEVMPDAKVKPSLKKTWQAKKPLGDSAGRVPTSSVTMNLPVAILPPSAHPSKAPSSPLPPSHYTSTALPFPPRPSIPVPFLPPPLHPKLPSPRPNHSLLPSKRPSRPPARFSPVTYPPPSHASSPPPGGVCVVGGGRVIKAGSTEALEGGVCGVRHCIRYGDKLVLEEETCNSTVYNPNYTCLRLEDSTRPFPRCCPRLNCDD